VKHLSWFTHSLGWVGGGWLLIGLTSPLQSNLQLNDCSHTRRIPDTKQRVFGSHLYGQPATQRTCQHFQQNQLLTELPGRLMSQGAAKLNRTHNTKTTKTIFIFNRMASCELIVQIVYRPSFYSRKAAHEISGFPQPPNVATLWSAYTWRGPIDDDHDLISIHGRRATFRSDCYRFVVSVSAMNRWACHSLRNHLINYSWTNLIRLTDPPEFKLNYFVITWLLLTNRTKSHRW
jgi:hypothetical protein